MSTTALPGVSPADVPYRLAPVEPALSREPHLAVEDCDARFRRAQPLYVARHLEPRQGWEGYWRRVPVDLLSGVFSVDELCRLWHGSRLFSRLDEHVEREHFFLWKVSNSQWRYGAGHDYNQLADHIGGLRRLAMPDFDVRIVWTPYHQAWSWCAQAPDVYLDASMGLLLYHGGKHVLTVGFAPSYYGIVVAQVQLREKKGNRFLYSLGGHYLDVVLDALHAAFGDQLWLTTGRSAADAVRRSYGSSACSMGPEAEARVLALYDRELADFDRDTESAQCFGRTYLRLRRRERQLVAA